MFTESCDGGVHKNTFEMSQKPISDCMTGAFMEELRISDNSLRQFTKMQLKRAQGVKKGRLKMHPS